MNEVAKMNDGVVVVADPFSPDTYHAASDVQSLIKSALSRMAMRVQQFTALGNIDEAPLEAVKTLRRAIEEDDAALKDFDGNVKNALLELSGFKAYIVQTKGTGSRIDALSVRGKLGELVKKLKAREEAEKVAAPKHTYVFQFECDDDALKKIVATIVKYCGSKFRYAVPQGDKGMNQAEKFFKENI